MSKSLSVKDLGGLAKHSGGSKLEATKSLPKVSLLEMAEIPTIQKLFEIKFSRDYFKQHIDEYHSTSPFAVTDKTAESRVESTPVTFTTFDPMNGQEYITTEIVRKDIFKCPVTSKEFTDDKLASQRSRIESAAKNFGYSEAKKLNYRQNFDTLAWVTVVDSKQIVLREIELQDFAYNPLKLVEKVEELVTTAASPDHKEAQHEQERYQ